jgi:hypothetical protein
MDPVIKTIIIQSKEGSSETVYAEQLSEDTFKLMENPLMNCRINYGTIVKVAPRQDGELVFTKIVRVSNFKTRQFFLNGSLNETELRIKLGQPVLDAGGMWEVVFGGICFVHLPRDGNFDLDELFKQHNYFPSEIIDDIEEHQ